MWQYFIFAAFIVFSLNGSGESQRFISREGSHEVLSGQDVQFGCVIEDAGKPVCLNYIVQLWRLLRQVALTYRLLYYFCVILAVFCSVFWRDDVFVPDEFTVIWSKEKEGGVDVIYAGPELMGTDSRFVLDNPTHNVWNLTIRNVVPFDEGIYLCQISTEDKPRIQRQRLSVKSESMFPKLSTVCYLESTVDHIFGISRKYPEPLLQAKLFGLGFVEIFVSFLQKHRGK